MKKNKNKYLKMKQLLILLLAAISTSASAQKANTWVNENISTHITFPEPIKYVDISTEKIAGDIPVANILRIKPIVSDSLTQYERGEIVAIVTVVTERGKKQFVCKYEPIIGATTTDLNISSIEMDNYIHPDVSMSTRDLYSYAWRIWNSNKKFYDVSKEAYKIKLNLYNIYTIGDYFFIDFVINNKTNIQYNIDQIRFKIEDKKQTKATNFQQIELTPERFLLTQKAFKQYYRNIYIFKKFTFPDEKVFTIELAEEQISGRTVKLQIDYSDILHADSFNEKLYR
jgi:conjugative transposon TraN protein